MLSMLQVDCKVYLNYLLHNGSTLDTLPLDRKVAEGILDDTVEARKADLVAVRQAYIVCCSIPPSQT